jgi:hypothetical protein
MIEHGKNDYDRERTCFSLSYAARDQSFLRELNTRPVKSLG